MGDPASIAGTAVGVVSLGLQVSQGLIEYYGQWKDFDADVTAMYASVEQLERGFRLVRENLSAERIAMLSSVREVEGSIQLCEAGIVELRRRLEKVRMREPLGSLRGKDALLNELKRQGKRLLYPFQKGTLGKLRDVVGELRDGLQPVFHAVQMDMTSLVLDEVKQMKRTYQKQRFDEEACKALSWLSPLDFHERQQDILSARHPATGLWFLEHKKFINWRLAAAGVPRGLWCIGSMGTGKSVLLASVIEHLKMLSGSEDVAVTYVFCNWQERLVQSVENILGAIVKQIVESLPKMPLMVTNYYKGYKNGKRPPCLQDLFAIFREITKSFPRVFIIADGLDEFGSADPFSERASMPVIESALEALLSDDPAGSQRVSLLISSRFEPQLTENAHNFESITISAKTEELRTFIRSELESASHLVTWVNPQLGQRIRQDTDLRNEVAERCVLRADNTYLLPRLHINRLKQQINLRQLLKTARILSVDMSQNIRQTMDRIQMQTETLKNIGIRVLFWTLKAMRPLRIDELRHALAMDSGDGELAGHDEEEVADEDFLHDDNMGEEELVPQALIVASCAGLVSVNDQTGIVRLIHLSIAQYLEQLEEAWFPSTHSAISKACLLYLSKDDFAKSDSGDENIIRRWLFQYPFLAYSLEYWGYHARSVPEEELLDLIESLILCRNRTEFLFRGLYLVLWDILYPCADQIPVLFLTSYFGLVATTGELLGNRKGADESDSMGRTALYIASALGHNEIVKILLSYGADVSGRKPIGIVKASGSAWWLPPWARDDIGSHALCVAAESGHIEVVQTLIENGARVSAHGSFQDGALEGATFWGHKDVVRLLLRHGAPITRNTLQCSAYSGHVDILEEFLQIIVPRADPDEITQSAATQDLPKALYSAALAGHTLYAEKLLRHGIDPNESTITSYRTPLQGAASRGHLEMINLLLQHGADINSNTECKEFYLLRKAQYFNKATPGTALQAAAFAGQTEAVSLLLQKGANENLQSGYYGTALQAAAAGGRRDVLDILLKRGAQVNLSCGFYGNALQAAASAGSEVEIRALLEAGADANAVGGEFGHALQAAAWNGNPTVIKLLLDAGAGPDSEGGRFGNALQAAAVGCPFMEPDPQLVIPKASSLPLEFQSYTNRPIDKLTLSNMKASQVFGSMMRQAGKSLETDVMKGAANLFPGIEEQVLVTNEGEVRREILESSQKSTQNVKAVEQLLKAGANGNKIGGKFYTALQAACYAGHLEIVDLLIERGADVHAFYDEENYPWLRHDALGRAIDSGHTAIVKHLLENGADARVSSAKSQTSVLHRAAAQNEDIVRMLLDFGAEVDKPDREERTPIMEAVIASKQEIVKLLIQEGADVNRHGTKSHGLLCLSMTFGPLDITRAILQARPSTESINASFRYLLVECHIFSKNELVSKLRDPMRLLLDHGADVNVGSTIADRDAAMLEIETGKISPPKYIHNLNPLSIVASQFGDIVELVRMLVDAGADLEKYGRDALWLATVLRHFQVREYLVGLGVQPEEKDETLRQATEEEPEDEG